MNKPDNPQSRPKVTIYDVAKEVGVAPSTVSRAFSRPGRVNSETGRRIREVAERMGYRTKPIAYAPTKEPTKTLAFVVSDISNPVYSDIMRGFQKEATQNGYVVMLIDSQEDDLKERKAIENVLTMMDGVVLTSSRMSDLSIAQIAKVKPVAVINRIIRGVPCIVPDVGRGVRRAVEQLATLGHTRITYLSGPANSWSDGARWRAISEACYELSLNVRRVGPNSPSLQGGIDATRKWLKNQTTAVIAYNDLMAIGFMKAIQKAKLRIPEDISVIGMDNSISGLLTSPTLTSIGPPTNTLGMIAARTLISQAQSGSEPSTEIMQFPMKLFVRESTARVTPFAPRT